jgi:hypothetical protein
MKRVALIAMSIWLLGAFLPMTATAKVAVVTLEGMAAQADLIFVGTAIETSAAINDAGMPVTDLTFALERVIKGAEKLTDQTRVTLRLAGGSAGERRLRVSHVPRIAKGEKVVVFTRHDGKPYASPIIGMTQGLFRVRQEPATGREVVVDHGGNALLPGEDGEIEIGNVIVLNTDGEFALLSQSQARPIPPLPRSNELNRVVVTKVRPMPQPRTDVARLLTLAAFVKIVEKLAEQPTVDGAGQ